MSRDPRERHAHEPHLSIVATSRNDGHGGNIQRRMQLFIDGVAAQAARHGLPVELVMVEWNPPADRPPLREALVWPEPSEHFLWRIITVPADVHGTLPHSDKLPLFQMIAKNVGIRRARAPWILSTNVDLLFSDELFTYLASERLQRGFHYRSDRVDVDPNVPDGPIQAQLAWCREHVLRTNRAWGVDHAPPHPSTPNELLLKALVAVEDAMYAAVDVAFPEKPFVPSQRVDNALARLGIHASRTFVLTSLPLLSWLTKRAAGRRTMSFAQLVDMLSQSAFDLPPLHFMACGDFMLMHRDDWAIIHGHPEIPIYSMHLDSLTLLTAEANGIREARLPPDFSHFHIEHGYGAQKDYAPDLDAAVRTSADKGIPTLTMHTLGRMYPAMKRHHHLLAPNDWGMAKRTFAETSAPAAHEPASPGLTVARAKMTR